jgi:uncharacterized membrane protein
MHHRNYNVGVKRSITVLKPVGEVYRMWRSPETWGRFAAGTQSVELLNERRSRWRVNIPSIGVKSWVSEITRDVENRELSWETVGETDFDHQARVSFKAAPGDHGTEVTLEIKSHLVGGRLTSGFAKLLGRSPEDYASRTLRNFKELVETGEVATNEGPAGVARVHTGVGPKVAMAGMVLGVLTTLLLMRRREAW